MSLLLDTQYLEGFVTEEELARCAGPLAAAGEALAAGDGAPKGWRTLPEGFPEPLLRQLADTGRRIRESAEVLLVIGIGGSYLGARAALDFLPKRPGCEVLFLGNSLSPSALAETLARCEGREVAVNVVSKSGTTTEPAIAFRVVLDWLRRRYGSRLRERVWCTTDPSGGALRSLCEEEGFGRFEIPRDIGGRFSVLTPVGLLPVAAGGGDIAALLDGAREGQRRYGGPACLENPAARLAAIADLLDRGGYPVSLFCSYEPYADSLCQWLIQLYGESLGKDGRGPFPAAARFTTDLHSLGQYIQEGRRMLWETVLSFDPGAGPALTVPPLAAGHDGLDYLTGRPLAEINRAAMLATAAAHHDGGVPVLLIEAGRREEHTLGELFYFFETACALTGCLMGVNPFDQPGVERYKQNLFRLLGKPGC